MREISFRAWDNENNHMIDIARFDFADYTVYSHLFACEGYLGENLKIMQYTGLKDKHGKEIYEGDIIEFSRGDDWRENEQKQGISEVVYSEQITAFAYHYKAKSSWGTAYDDVVCAIGNITDQCGDLEIIGNTYENPELLEEL
ncbi:putative phage protein (TIGR01671 family) [Virgibacillus halotolerans]|uniref:YopX family protein n=1 Tax=Virgibacillus halotolerans TaxID=1071053 RepID=UPI00195F3852|nr:YopX family protein [Virgibacillus halotolerans]MBM7598183.1 putative phage protein (TIGR01671 family) [Virgibacillus halotolerans]